MSFPSCSGKPPHGLTQFSARPAAGRSVSEEKQSLEGERQPAAGIYGIQHALGVLVAGYDYRSITALVAVGSHNTPNQGSRIDYQGGSDEVSGYPGAPSPPARLFLHDDTQVLMNCVDLIGDPFTSRLAEEYWEMNLLSLGLPRFNSVAEVLQAGAKLC